MSRVNKNQKLYEELSNSAEGDLSNSSLSSYAEKLKDINEDYQTIPVAKEVSIHEPIHAKNIEVEAVNKAETTSSIDTEEAIDDILWNTFENNYLKEFIDEVKQYNVKKGYRRLSDTNANIMAELSAGNTSRFNSSLNDSMSTQELPVVESEPQVYVAPIVEPIVLNTDNVQSVDENTIALEVQKMVEEIEEFGSFDSDTAQLSKASEQIIRQENESFISEKVNIDEQEIADNQEQIKELLESTQQLKLQVDDYKQNLEEMNSRVALTNRVISFLMYVLIVAILVVILLFVWWTIQ